jgi:hypothetical protein
MGKLLAFSIVGVAVFLGAVVFEVTRRSAQESPSVPAEPRVATGQIESAVAGH